MAYSLDPSRKVVLIGCGKAKQATQCRAEDLYTGTLFRARRQYAEDSKCNWWIVSARHGLVGPKVVLLPYDLRITDLSQVQRASWALGLVTELIATVKSDSLCGVSLELHLGDDYCDPLTDILGSCGFKFDRPLRGLSQGEQMGWYAAQRRRTAS